METGLQIVLSPIDLAGSTINLNPSGGTPTRNLRFLRARGSQHLRYAAEHRGRAECTLPVYFAARLVRLADEKREKSAGASRLTFVDGGYVDNSGVATALAIAQRLDAMKLPDVEFRILMLSALWAPIERLWIQPPPDPEERRADAAFEGCLECEAGTRIQNPIRRIA